MSGIGEIPKGEGPVVDEAMQPKGKPGKIANDYGAPKDVQMDEPKDAPEVPIPISKENPKENPKGIPKDIPKDTPKENPRFLPEPKAPLPPPPSPTPFPPSPTPSPTPPPARTSIVIETKTNPNLSAQATYIPDNPTVTLSKAETADNNTGTSNSAGIIFGIMVALVIVIGVIVMFIRKKLPELRKNKSSGARSLQRTSPTNEKDDLVNTNHYDSSTSSREPQKNDTTDNYNTSLQIPMMSQPQNPPQLYSNPNNYSYDYQPRPSHYPPGHGFVYTDPAIPNLYQRNQSPPPINEVYYNRVITPPPPNPASPNRSNYSKYDRMMNKPLPSVP